LGWTPFWGWPHTYLQATVACADHENGRYHLFFNHQQKFDDYPCFLLMISVSLSMFGLNRTS